MSRKLDHALGLYLEGIGEGKMQAALDKYTGDRYTQHSTGVADGKEGFVAFFTDFLKRNPVRDIQVIRTIEDGRYVFCHVAQSLNHGESRWVTADLFDTDEQERIIEHWDVIQAGHYDAEDERSLVAGPRKIENVQATEKNRALMQAFVQQVLLPGNFEKAKEYLHPTALEQHGVGFSNGPAAYLEYLQSAGGPRYLKCHRLLCQGNFAVIYNHLTHLGEEHASFEIFRFDAGRIVERWEVSEKIAPEAEWNNSGKF